MKRDSAPGSVVTLTRIARVAGVSRVTASRALGDSPLVAQQTRERITAIAAQLGYTPNLLAKGLVQNRTSTLGVVLRELANPFFAPMLSSIEAVAARRGFLVVVGESGKSLKGERLNLSRFLQLRISGIVVTPVASDMSHLTAARGRGTPVVAMARVWGDGDYVTGDNREGGRLVAQHFLERGHRRLGVVSPDEPDNTAIQGRVAGFREQLGSTFLAVPPQWDVRTHGATLEDGVEAADRILAHDARPSAIFAATDVQAIGMVRRLIARGIQVPQDIAVVGYDDIPFADYAPIPLSSVAVPVRRIGELAAEVLFDRLDGLNPETLRQIVLPPQLIVRASG